MCFNRKHKKKVIHIPHEIPPELFNKLDGAIEDLKTAVKELKTYRNNI
jgi:hypothetical protein